MTEPTAGEPKIPGTDSTLPASPPSSKPRRGITDDLPESIGPYPVVRRLGKGGMGEVFLAQDDRLSRRIALKRVRIDRASEPELLRRFELEARVTALLQHPAIIPIYHYVSNDGGTYYTMRPVEGLTLGELLARLRSQPSARKEWSPGRLVRLFLQAANAIAYAHSRGIVHRDLKPANIMIGPFEEVLVLDWGMARIKDDSGEDLIREGRPREGVAERLRDASETAFLAGIEQTGSALVGTPGYMAPEQYSGIADQRSEVFSLAIILYELLALRPPWKGHSVADLQEAMKDPPRPPHAVRPGSGIPSPLSRVVLRALSVDPDRRYPSVKVFSREVADALEGKAAWQLRRESRDSTYWRLAQGKLRREPGEMILSPRGEQGFRYFCLQSFGNDIRFEFDVCLRRGSHELSVWFNTTLGRQGKIDQGYELHVVPGRRRTLSLMRSGRDVAGARSPVFEPRCWYRVVARRFHGRLSLFVDNEEVYTYSDPIPLSGGYIGLTGRGLGVRIRDLRVYSLGTDTMVSCLSVPDAFYNRKLFEEARTEYERIAASHPGRREGRLARFRAGLCALDAARLEKEPEMRNFLLGEAKQSFRDLNQSNESCLTALGRAMVASELGHTVEQREALAEALIDYPDDPQRRTVHEWLLGRVHSLGPDRRASVAALIPLAIDHCMTNWGRRVVRELVNQVRNVWETPSFLSGRARFRENDPISHAEAKLFFDFWCGRPEEIEATANGLFQRARFGPHHVADFIFALLELGDEERAQALFEQAQDRVSGDATDLRFQRVLRYCGAVLDALRGDLDRASAALMDRTDEGPPERISNSARLWIARACRQHGESAILFRTLKPTGMRDSFAREHTAWFSLLHGDVDQATRVLRPLIARNDHLRGRNLANFLHGATLLARQREGEARQVFERLPAERWPRTWTLGSYYATERLGSAGVHGYLEEAFPWELTQLQHHRELLLQVGFKPTES